MKDVNELFRDKNIYIKEHDSSYISEITQADCIKQISYIIEFQNRIMGYRENIIPRLSSSIGKELESFKVSLKKLKRCINCLENNRDNSIGLYVKSNKDDLFNRAEESIDSVLVDEYHRIIKRSMSRYEVCLGKCDRSNLVVDENRIKIVSIKYMSYNLVEYDIYSYIKKIKKRKLELDYLDLIKFFVDKSNLGEASINYIISLLRFPSEEVKLLQRYSSGKLDITSDNFISMLDRERKNNEVIVKSFEGVI